MIGRCKGARQVGWTRCCGRCRSATRAQQTRELLERDWKLIAKQQTITSSAEMVKRFEEKACNDLEKQFSECKSKLSRAQRQISLLKSPLPD